MKRFLLTALWVGTVAVAFFYGRAGSPEQERAQASPPSTLSAHHDGRDSLPQSTSPALARLWQQASGSPELRGDLGLKEAILRAWARENPTEALSIAASLPTPQCDEAKEIVLEAWLVHDFAGALAWITAHDRAFLLSERFVSAATQVGEFRQAALALRSAPNTGGREQWLFARNFESLAAAWSTRDRAAAFAWLSTLSAEERKLATLGYVSA